MIYRLEIENFYSIRETQVIDLRIGAKVPDEGERFGRLRDGSDVRVPKTVAFFGANASGKSTVLKALAFLRWFLLESFSLPPEASLPLLRFADGNADPTRIKVHFDWFSELTNADPEILKQSPFSQYIYEVRLSGVPGGRMTVLSEELRLQPVAGKSRKVFERNEAGDVESGSNFSLKGLSHVMAKLRTNVSTTSTIAQFAEHAPTVILLGWARRVFPNIFVEKTPVDEQNALQYYAKHPDLVEALNGVLGRVDLGIRSMSLMEDSDGVLPWFEHSGLRSALSIRFESAGTRQFLHMYPILWNALRAGGIAVLDEMDSTIHPMLLPEILRWFHTSEMNPHNAQLWMSGHSASLLEELKKEEAYFTEKDRQGRTKVFSLKDIEGVRRVDNFYQKYLGGVYGAVPRIG
jgi:hypothetical protein